MRTKSGGRSSAIRFHVMLLTLALVPAWAQEYSIDWHTTDGGGGTSTGGVYAVSGTIGQPDAGEVMTGGAFSLQGGFWALPIALQTTDAPTLTIMSASPGFATISWDATEPGFVLQSNPSLNPLQWTVVPNGGTPPVTVPASFPATFYRLHRP